MTSKTTTERFWSHVQVGEPDECWDWTGTTTIHGYGRFKVSGKMISVHRYSYELSRGNLPSDLDICHTCNNRRCVNPKHLYAGTAKQNVADAIRAGTQHNFQKTGTRGTRRHRGTAVVGAVLTEQRVLEIFHRVRAGETHRAIAFEYGVGKTTVSKIASGQCWGWLTHRSGSDQT